MNDDASGPGRPGYTPGPWSIVGDDEIVGPDDREIAHLYELDPWEHGHTFRPCDENDANARLIAAAPDLAEALRPFIVYYEWLVHLQPFDDPDPPPDDTTLTRLQSPGGTVAITFGHLRAAAAALAKADNSTHA